MGQCQALLQRASELTSRTTQRGVMTFQLGAVLVNNIVLLSQIMMISVKVMKALTMMGKLRLAQYQYYQASREVFSLQIVMKTLRSTILMTYMTYQGTILVMKVT